jgi:poly-gamma-glutamate synthesis protein (capsule biosynthesis protein)
MDNAPSKTSPSPHQTVTLFLCGDVMPGRGIDQILSHPGDRALHEPSVKDARFYVELAERRSGPIPRGVDDSYIWGDALGELQRRAPDLRMINLETAVTTSDDFWPGKQIHYRMNPQNVGCLTAADIDCCVLANNHVLDWGYAGLEETLRTLERAGIATAGAGRNLEDAQRPAVFELPQGNRVLMFGMGSASSGIPPDWAAATDRPGVHLIDECLPDAARQVQDLVQRFKRPADLVVVSVHWGPNWGSEISPDHQKFAHDLIEQTGVHVVHGHSSHHIKCIEVYRNRPIFYGCGDFLTDYEGIRGYETYRGDLGLMNFVTLDSRTVALVKLELCPMQMWQMRVRRASATDSAWLGKLLNREGCNLRTRILRDNRGWIDLVWD